MKPYRGSRPQNVGNLGAAAGSILRGIGGNNQGLRLKVLQAHPRGDGGPLKGGFVILDAGDNVHAPFLVSLVGRVTTADEVLPILRRERPGCVNVANANILAPEADPGEAKPRPAIGAPAK
jgi:hypothetical protein